MAPRAYAGQLQFTTMNEQDHDFTPQSLIAPAVTPDVEKIFSDIIKYRVDAQGQYYGVTLDSLVSQLHSINQTNVVAIDAPPGGNLGKTSEKGHMYDPILQSFVQGAGGRISYWDREQENRLPAVLRGVTKRKEMEQCRHQSRDFYYIDTGYFGNAEKKKLYHRITKNDVQNFGPVLPRPSDRFDQTGLRIKKVRKDGSKILLAPPSQKLLNLYNINLDEWLASTISEIHQNTDREIVVRNKQSRSVRQTTDTMQSALDQDIYCLVTFSSIAAVEAILHGKPAIVLGPNAAAPVCSKSLTEIENIYIPTVDQTREWAYHLAYCQFTEAEMRNGTAWQILNA